MSATPKVRFKGYTDDWEQRKLGTEADIIAGGDIDKELIKKFGKYPVVANSPENGGILGYYEEEYRVEAPAVTVAGRGVNIGYAEARTVNFTPVVRLLSVKSKHDVFFLENAINNHKVIRESTGVPQLTVPQLGDYALCFPSELEEEIKIGELFHRLDNLITLHQRKCDKIKELKKGCLQKMFPKDGSDVPEIRFPGFTDAWEQRKLSEITSLITKGTTPKDKSGDGEINFIKVENIDSSSGEIKDCSKISIEEHEGYLKRSQLKENDILFSIAGTLGRTTVVNKGLLPANTNQALAILRMSEGNISYIVTVLKGRAVSDFVRKNPTVGAQPNLSLEQVSNLEIPYPNIDEQAKIGSFFRDIDNLITLHQRKCDELKEVKRFMLRNMFPEKG